MIYNSIINYEKRDIIIFVVGGKRQQQETKLAKKFKNLLKINVDNES